MIIPHTSLSTEALRRIVEEFVSREGTDYGTMMHSFDSKVQAVFQQLESGKACVVFDSNSETCDIVIKGSLRYRQVVASMSSDS